MKKSILALASGAFVYGAAEFVMMGILPHAAHDMGVSIPTAGNFVSAYAIGVCIGTLILVFGRKTSPKRLIMLFMVIAAVGNLFSALAPSAPMLLIGRLIAGLPHGAFFGTSALIAQKVAEKGKEARAVSQVVTGQTVANMLGVPAGTLIADHVSWRIAFLFLALMALITVAFVLHWVPFVAPVADAGIAGQFRFLSEPGPWLILAATFLGNTGIFSWWSYISPWLTTVGGFRASAVPLLMMLAGFGMVIGGLLGGRMGDHWRTAGTAGLGQIISVVGLATVAFAAQGKPGTAACTFIIAFAMFFVSSPQQLLMSQAGVGGGELIGGACVQIAFNLGNAAGSSLGAFMLSSSHMDYHSPALGGLPVAVASVILLIVYSLRFETRTDAIDRLTPVGV